MTEQQRICLKMQGGPSGSSVVVSVGAQRHRVHAPFDCDLPPPRRESPLCSQSQGNTSPETFISKYRDCFIEVQVTRASPIYYNRDDQAGGRVDPLVAPRGRRFRKAHSGLAPS
jgi:hypothetical protein